MKLWNKDFILVIIGQIISLFGNAVLRFALPLYILEQSGSPALFGLISALSFLPLVLLAPVGGLIADRVNKQRIMVVLDFATSALILLYIIVSGYLSAVPVVVVMLMALYAIQGAYSPAVQASIPLLVGTEHLMPANAAVNLVSSLSGMLGPVIGGILFGTFGLGPVLAVSCGCFLFSAVMELFIKIPHKKIKSEGGMLSTAAADMRGSLRFIFKEKPVLSNVVLILFLFNIALSAFLAIGMPVLVTKTLGLSSELYGVSQGIMAAGGLLGGVMAGVLSKKLSVNKVHHILLFDALSILPMCAVLFLPVGPFTAYIVITAMGFLCFTAATMGTIPMFAFIQTITPPELLGKVFACLMAMNVCAQPIGQALYGWLFERFANTPWIIALGAAFASGIIALYSRRCLSTITAEPARQTQGAA